MSKWCTRDGREIEVADMDTNHLRNTIALIERTAQRRFPDELAAAYRFESMLQGEMAIDCMDREIHTMEEEGWRSILPPIYDEMVDELESREGA